MHVLLECCLASDSVNDPRTSELRVRSQDLFTPTLTTRGWIDLSINRQEADSAISLSVLFGTPKISLDAFTFIFLLVSRVRDGGNSTNQDLEIVDFSLLKCCRSLPPINSRVRFQNCS